jgi:hypothetical protein
MSGMLTSGVSQSPAGSTDDFHFDPQQNWSGGTTSMSQSPAGSTDDFHSWRCKRLILKGLSTLFR